MVAAISSGYKVSRIVVLMGMDRDVTPAVELGVLKDRSKSDEGHVPWLKRTLAFLGFRHAITWTRNCIKAAGLSACERCLSLIAGCGDMPRGRMLRHYHSVQLLRDNFLVHTFM